MKTSSCKAKGRRCSSAVKDLLLKYAPELVSDDILVTSSGVGGEDLVLSPKAREIYNFSVECKAVEKLNIWDAYSQAHSHSLKRQNSTPILFFKRNRSEILVCLRAEDFLRLTK